MAERLEEDPPPGTTTTSSAHRDNNPTKCHSISCIDRSHIACVYFCCSLFLKACIFKIDFFQLKTIQLKTVTTPHCFCASTSLSSGSLFIIWNLIIISLWIPEGWHNVFCVSRDLQQSSTFMNPIQNEVCLYHLLDQAVFFLSTDNLLSSSTMNV